MTFYLPQNRYYVVNAGTWPGAGYLCVVITEKKAMKKEEGRTRNV